MADEQKTRFNLVSETGDGVGFAVKLESEGYKCATWIRSDQAKSVGDRLTTKVGDLDDCIRVASPERDVFLFDVSGNGVIADYLRGRGFAVLGGSMLADRLERDREFGYDVMQGCKIAVPETMSFTGFAEAIRFVESRPDVRWVYKPSKQLGDLSPSHVSYDSEDLIQMLQNIDQEVEIADPQFELQAFEEGIALSTELWFQNGEFIAPLTNHTLERKELMNDNLGPSGGCMGNIVWMCEGCPACDIAKRLVSWAESARYHGPLDINVIVAKDEIYGLEFTPRFGYDASPTFLYQLVKRSLGEFLAMVAAGRLTDVDTRDDVFASALRISIPPWPSEKHTADENVPVRGLGRPKEWMNDTYLYNVKLDTEGQLVTAGAWGILLLLTHRGATVGGSFKLPLARAHELKIKGKQFRTDLVKQFHDDLAELEIAFSNVISPAARRAAGA